MNFNKKEESSSLERFIATLDNEILSDSEAVAIMGGDDKSGPIDPGTNKQICTNGNCPCPNTGVCKKS